MPSPGTVNYVEGQVALDGQNLSAASAGSALLETNQVLSTGQVRAELLYLSADNRSKCRA